MIKKIGLYRDPRNKRKPWVVRWFGEPDETNKQKRYTKSFKLKVDAENFKAEQTTNFTKGKKQRDNPEEISLRDFCSDWLKTQKPNLRPETVKLYQNAIRRLLAYFGQIAISKITPRSAAKFISELKRLDGRDGELSNWARHRTLRNCKTMFSTAIDWELIPKNPFKKTPKPTCILRDWHYLKPQEYHKLLEVAPSLRRRAMYALAYTAGLRLGELLNLMWDDIDFETGKVNVRNRLSDGKLPPFYIKDYEARTIPLPEHTLAILIDLKAYNEVTDQTPFVLLDDRQYKTATAKWHRFNQIGRNWRSQDMQNNTLSTFKRHVKLAGIRPKGTLSIHTLRKCCIQNWANNITNPEVIRVLAGHKELKTTMKYYAQADPEQMTKAAAAIDMLLSKTDVKLTYGDNQI